MTLKIFKFISINPQRVIMPVLWIILMSTITPSTKQNTLLILEVSNIKSVRGNLVVSIYDKKENFLEKGFEFKKMIHSVDGPAMTFKIEGLPLREYSIATFHDENADGDCNLNFLGVPIEGYGFSNNLRPIFSAPKFEKTKFDLRHNQQLHIRLIQ